MWWESLPSLAIVGTALALPTIFTYLTNKLVLGTPYKRALFFYDDAHHYLRDMRLSGNPYTQLGLANLDDDDNVEKKKEEKKK